MNERFRSIHLAVGIATVTIFLVTGVYMRINFPDLYQQDETIRFQFRANHVYILFCGLLNIALGLYAVYEPMGWRRILPFVGSVLLYIAPVVLIMAFVLEPVRAVPVRPLTFVGTVLSLGGMVLHGVRMFGRKDGKEPL
jgi:magnesium-transporting ATPase (P-type)